MKKLIILAVAGFSLVMGDLAAQTVTPAKKENGVTPSQVLSYAKAARQLLGSRTYDPIVIRKRIDKSSPLYDMLPYFEKGNAIINKVIREGNGITPANAIKYEQEIQEVSDGITRLIAVTQMQGGIPDCFKGCDNNYVGTGGGTGWKRFTCKMACLIVETAN